MVDPEIRRTIEQMSQRARQLGDGLQDMTAKASDDRGHVTVTCGPGGRLIDITFDPMSRRLDTHELRDTVLTAVNRAMDAAQKRLKDEMSGFVDLADGLDSEVIRQTNQQITDYRNIIDEQIQKISTLRASLER
jgi:DNA-binding protein YbaB